MSYSMYHASVPPLLRGLRGLGAVLAKGQADATARDFAPEILLQSRLAPDMFPLVRQVQIASDSAKGSGRLAGGEVPSFPDTETSFEQLQERIARTASYLESLAEPQFDGSEARIITLKLRDRAMELPGATFLNAFVLPNFYFHATAAYAILRHNGVKVGKSDYLGAE